MFSNSQDPSGVATQLERVQEQLAVLQKTASATDSRERALSSVLQWFLHQLAQGKTISGADLRAESKTWDQNFESWRGPLTDREEWRAAIGELIEAIPKPK